MNRTTIAAGLLLLSTIACNAYSLINPNLEVKWGPGNVPFYIDLGKYDSVINASLADWTQYTGRTKLIGIDSNSSGSFLDGRNDVRWGTEVFPSNVLAWAELNYNWETGRMLECDIEYNPRWVWSSFGAEGGLGYDVGRVALHEIGHAIGLGHTWATDAIMEPNYNQGRWELRPDDIAGAQFLYGNVKSVPEGGSTIGLMALALVGLIAVRKKAMLPMIFALALISSASAQQITNVGLGLAGNGSTATAQAYNIGISDDGQYIVENGTWYPIQLTTQKSLAYTNVVKWDGVLAKYVQYGIARITYGTQILGGMIRIRVQPRFKLVDFSVVGYEGVMPNVVVSNSIAVYVKSPITGTFVPRPDLTINNPSVNGAMWLNSDYSLHSAVYDTFGGMVPISQLTIIPAPGGLGGVGGATLPGVYPTKVR